MLKTANVHFLCCQFYFFACLLFLSNVWCVLYPLPQIWFSVFLVNGIQILLSLSCLINAFSLFNVIMNCFTIWLISLSALKYNCSGTQRHTYTLLAIITISQLKALDICQISDFIFILKAVMTWNKANIFRKMKTYVQVFIILQLDCKKQHTQ